MSENASTLPANVVAALEKGQTIEAIKLLRESSGLGLKEAKDMAEEFLRIAARVEAAAAAARVPGAPPASVSEALQRGDRIEAIKRLRRESGLDLKDSKEAVDSWIAANPAWGAIAPRKAGSPRAAAILTLLLAAAAAWWLLHSTSR